jgi:hypothetical protein
MQFIAVLIVAALFVKYFWVLVAVIAGIYVAYRIGREIRRWQAEADAAAAAKAERVDGLRARADQQNQWVMQGDPRGTFGESASTT